MMNETIRELLLQAREETREGNWKPPTAVWTERFAELIVRECAQVCRDQPEIYALKADRDNCAIAIEQHFGVE